MTFDEAIARLDAAGLWDEMLHHVEMEPRPAGALLFDDVTVVDPDPVHIGGDSSGGAYVRLASGAVALLSSEGEAAVVGLDLATVLAAGLGVGGLHDALRYTALPDVAEARAAWVAARAAYGLPAGPFDPDAAREIGAALDLDPLPDPFGRLHAVVGTTPEPFVTTPDGPFQRFGVSFFATR
ncbi:hypothetical protein JQC91_16665 [Jannaschia sp. Os4]|uniref:hypothetical protein n=1 Tax=Jannaschia sp. Os4 TaxID=2807617 RepID=UPI00193AC479|nr:hypothetical protein [Jannaschia sp. Os4]MBM2577940.1 hypothetical protein [Jannaschia sp. Os4]